MWIASFQCNKIKLIRKPFQLPVQPVNFKARASSKTQTKNLKRKLLTIVKLQLLASSTNFYGQYTYTNLIWYKLKFFFCRLFSHKIEEYVLSAFILASLPSFFSFIYAAKHLAVTLFSIEKDFSDVRASCRTVLFLIQWKLKLTVKLLIFSPWFVKQFSQLFDFKAKHTYSDY